MAGQHQWNGASSATDESLELTRLRVENRQLRIELNQALQAMAAREIIEQAKGLLMGYYRCEPAPAFAVLRELSQRSNTKLREIAVSLVEVASREGRVNYPGLDAVAEMVLVDAAGSVDAAPTRETGGPSGWQ